MAARVSWLVANRLVEPEAILGLTFTRKAASELNERVRLRLGRARPAPRHRRRPPRAARHRPADGLDLPRLRGRAGRRARPADRRRARRRRARPGDVLGPGRHGRDGVDRRHERRPADPADHGRGRAGARRRARASTTSARRRCAPGRPGWRRRSPATPTPRARRARTRTSPTMLARQRARVALLPLVEAFEARKRAAGAIDYADQVAYAARIAVASAEVGRRERARWKVVLLDEYQDTSVGQLRMLEALFGRDTGHPVLAVGDPRQSIYGWRGASAGTIERFARTFPGLPGPAGRAAHAGHQLAQRPRPSSPSPTRCRRCCRRPTSRCPTSRPAPTAGRGRSPSGSTTPSPRRPRRWPTGSPRAGTRTGRRRRTARRPWPCWSGPASSCPGIAAALRERGVPGGGRRAGRPARGAGGVRRRRDADRAGRPHRRRRARPAAHRRALADRPARPRRAGGPRPGAGALAPARARPTARPTRAGRGRPPSAAASSRRSTTSAVPTPTRPRATGGCAGWARELGAPAHPAERVAARPGRRGGPHPRPGDRAGQRARASARPVRGPTSTRCTGSPRSSPSWPSCRRCRPSSATCATPRSASAAWSRVRWRSTRRRCSCSPGTPAKGLEWDVVAVPGHDQGPVPGQGRHQRLLDQGPGRGARRPAAHRPRGAAAAAAAGARAPATRRW